MNFIFSLQDVLGLMEYREKTAKMASTVLMENTEKMEKTECLALSVLPAQLAPKALEVRKTEKNYNDHFRISRKLPKNSKILN
jgi:hypothetical protein